jgi:hypothetical protein
MESTWPGNWAAIYGEQAAVVVIFASADTPNGTARLERRAAQAWAVREGR